MTDSEMLEVEREFDVGEGDGPPAPALLRGVDGVGPPEEAPGIVYFDTAGLALASRRITLSRRTGGPHAGWRLNLALPVGGRQEFSAPVGRNPEVVPRRLRQLVQVHTRDRDVIPVATLHNPRTSQRVFAAEGTALADFSEDRVEFARGVEGQNRPAADSPPGPAPEGPASAAFLAYLGQQVEALKKHDPGVREDAPDSVHQLRVAARRIRSTLATFRKLADSGATGTLRSELQWLAGTVGEARDNEVMQARLLALIGAEPQELLLGPVAQRIAEHFDAAAPGARAKGLIALKSARYFRLLDSLDAFLAEPPLTETAAMGALQTVDRIVSDEIRRLRRKVDALDVDSVSAAQEAALHEVRKSAKRVRYAAEAAVPIFGKQADTLARAAAEIQESLGEHQDSVVTAALLLELAANASGAQAFTYGRLHAREQLGGDAARRRFFRTWQESPPDPFRWK
ncbi:MAG: CYTH and CHAD domain-containing protein [Arthrobacter sp.]